jgi:hypothetical protein
MDNLASDTRRFTNLLDAVAAHRAGSLASHNAVSPKISDLSPSVEDDVGNVAPSDLILTFSLTLSPSSPTLLGPSVGDDAGAPSPSSLTILGPSVGDDGPASPSGLTMLGPSVGDDTPGSPASVTMLGPSVGDDNSESDVRLKEDVHRIGTTVFGLPLYRFKYLGKPGTYEGVMAQDVLQVMPSAVSRAADGYYRVNYRALGTSMRQVSA